MSDQPEMTDTSDGCLRGALQDTGTQASRQLTRAISPARPETADRASEETTLQERARVALRNTLIGVFSSPMQVSTPIFLSTMELDRIIAAVVEVFRATPSAEVIEAGAIAIFASRFGADPEFTAAASKDWPKFDESVHEEFRRQSRAAYQAMESAKATEWRGFDVRPSEPMMVEYDEPLVVSPLRAQRLLDVGHSHLYELIAARELESYKDGKSRKITVHSIKSYIKRRLHVAAHGTNQ